MNIADFKRIHFIGCGGVGTAPLMRIVAENGFQVSGSDMEESPNTLHLKRLGLKVFVPHDPRNLPTNDGTPTLVVYSSAVTNENSELSEALKRSWPAIRRGEALALAANSYSRCVAVSGSHGKTSVTAMISWILRKRLPGSGWLVGGSVTGDEFNGEAGRGLDCFVTEADESDGTHTFLTPYIGVVTNVEDDHAWSLGGVENLYANFRKFAMNSKHLIYNASERCDALCSDHPSAVRITETPQLELFKHVKWGAYQRSNAYAAILAAEMLGIKFSEAESALESYPGVERRMSIRFESEDLTVIEDYAHHPTELAASISALRESYPGKHLTIVFQPHRYARLERYFNEFAAILSRADNVFVTPVFAAWTSGGKKTSTDLAEAVKVPCRALSGTWDEMASAVKKSLGKDELVAVIGAGDIKDILTAAGWKKIN